MRDVRHRARCLERTNVSLASSASVRASRTVIESGSEAPKPQPGVGAAGTQAAIRRSSRSVLELRQNRSAVVPRRVGARVVEAYLAPPGPKSPFNNG